MLAAERRHFLQLVRTPDELFAARARHALTPLLAAVVSD
jgi:hypothetical protein